jgi:hypothetical protein
MPHHITISWTASPGPISGYNIRRGTAHGNEGSVPLNAVPVVGTTYTDNAVFPGVSYSYEVTAVYNGVESSESLDILSPPVPFDPSPPHLDGYLGVARSFSVLAGSTVTETGTTECNGDVGVFPGTSITGFGPPSAISGVFHAGDFVAAAAQTAVAQTFAYGNSLPGAVSIPADIGGEILGPGVYAAPSSLAITGDLILDAHGNVDGVWVFQIPSTLTTASGNSHVMMMGGGQPDNVYWLVGSSATLGTGTAFCGNVLAATSITANTNALLDARLLAQSGAVTLDTNEIILFTASGAFVNLPASPPNVPPAPPVAPTALIITSEV